MRPLLASLALVATGLLGTSRADACVLRMPEPHALDDAQKAVDTAAPSAVTATVHSIERGKGQKFLEGVSDCDGEGRLHLAVSATDDRTPPDQLGFEVTLESGALPAAMHLYDEPVRARDGLLLLVWADEAVSEQEPLDFTLAVVAVDLAGNRSAPALVHVTDPGPSGCGCSTSGTATPLAALLAAGLIRRRPR